MTTEVWSIGVNDQKFTMNDAIAVELHVHADGVIHQQRQVCMELQSAVGEVG